MVPNVPKINVFVKLPFLRITLFQIQKKLQKLFSSKLMSCSLKIVFTSPVRVKSFFIFKDKLPKMLLSGLVQCGAMLRIMERPSATLKSEFVNIQAFHISLEKKVKIDNRKLMAIQEHLLCCKYSPSFEDFSILTRESNDFKLKIMESVLIARDKSILNKADSSLHLDIQSYFNITSVVII